MQDNKYERYFSNWISEHLPESSEGQLITDIDFFIGNYNTKKFMLLELKTRGNDIQQWQRGIYSMLHKRLLATNGTDGWEFVGTHLIKFEKETFYDGNVYLNGDLVDEYKLITFLYNKLGLEYE